MYLYDQKFYEYISRGSKRSAEKIVPYVLSSIEGIKSVLDVGCGAGAWLAVWKGHDVKVLGIDGDYVNRDYLFIDPKEFMPADLSKGFNLERKFDLVQSLEVAEHLPESSADLFVESLCKHGTMILFSAAPPGQGGDNHVNEQPYEYWRRKFSVKGYVAVDLIRNAFGTDSSVEPWYRYNTVLYVEQSVFAALPSKVKGLEIKGEIKDYSPVLYRARKALVKVLPPILSTKIAKVKETVVVWRYKFLQ